MARLPASAVALLAAGLLSPAANAKVYFEWHPRVTLLGGFDDNVRFDGTGGDGFGQAVPGLSLEMFGDHQLHANVDCQVGFARLWQKGAGPIDNGLGFNDLCGVQLFDRPGQHVTVRLNVRAMYAQDPFALSGLGLLFRVGQNRSFDSRMQGEVKLQNGPRTTTIFAFSGEQLYFTSGDRGNGMVLAPSVAVGQQLTLEDQVEFTVREQVFFGLDGPRDPQFLNGRGVSYLSQGTAALVGWNRRLGEVTTLRVKAGPLLLTDADAALPAATRAKESGVWFQPVGILELESATPKNGVRLTVMHDVAIGAALAGPQVGDLAEVGTTLALVDSLALHLRGGLYRNQLPVPAAGSSFGYSGEADLDWKLARQWTIGISALRDARLGDPVGAQLVDRNVVQMRLTWERGRY